MSFAIYTIVDIRFNNNVYTNRIYIKNVLYNANHKTLKCQIESLTCMMIFNVNFMTIQNYLWKSKLRSVFRFLFLIFGGIYYFYLYSLFILTLILYFVIFQFSIYILYFILFFENPIKTMQKNDPKHKGQKIKSIPPPPKKKKVKKNHHHTHTPPRTLRH